MKVGSVLLWLARNGIGTRYAIEVARMLDDALNERDAAIKEAVSASINAEYWKEKSGSLAHSLFELSEFVELVCSIDRLHRAMKFFFQSSHGVGTKEFSFVVGIEHLMTAEQEAILLMRYPSKSLEEIVGVDNVHLLFIRVGGDDGRVSLLISDESSATLVSTVRSIEKMTGA
jgi:hypothetical protein